MILLSTAYFPPIQYFTKLSVGGEIYIDQHEHFIKQTYRNRAIILGANGILSLIVPVVKGRSSKTPIKDLRISYDEDWQRNHWRTIFSAYNSSPFFEYFADDIAPLLQTRYEFLLDLNMEILSCMNELLGIYPTIQLTDEFKGSWEPAFDFREAIHPKKHRMHEDISFSAEEYTQVFSAKFGFVPNLSILDLLFNLGPQAEEVLKSCVKYNLDTSY